MKKTKLKVTRYFETPGFIIDKQKWKLVLENVKTKTRHSCSNDECSKYGLMFEQGIPTLEPRIEPGETCYKLTLYLMCYGEVWRIFGVWVFGNGYLCSNGCLKEGYKQIESRINSYIRATQKEDMGDLKKRFWEAKGDSKNET